MRAKATCTSTHERTPKTRRRARPCVAAPRKLLRGGYRVLLLGNIGLLIVAGHGGGNLTHGSNYLTKNAPEFMKAMVE